MKSRIKGDWPRSKSTSRATSRTWDAEEEEDRRKVAMMELFEREQQHRIADGIYIPKWLIPFLPLDIA